MVRVELSCSRQVVPALGHKTTYQFVIISVLDFAIGFIAGIAGGNRTVPVGRTITNSILAYSPRLSTLRASAVC